MSTKREKLTSVTVEVADVHADENVIDTRITNLTPKMQRFVHLYSTGQYTLNKLAQLLELHPNTLTNWLRRADVREVLHDLQESTHDVVQHNLKTLSNVAVDKLRELLSSPIDGVSLQAVKDVLDRTGHKPETKIKVDKTVTTIEQRLASLIEETIVDADYEVIE